MLARPMMMAAVVIIAGCARGPVADPDTADTGESRAKQWYEERFAEGRAVYERSCASCHDPGASAAPAIGVREDWDGRSRLWTAVLFEHAKAGYLGMPGKGGDPGLSDKEVGVAAEYMLAVTYPEFPVD